MAFTYNGVTPTKVIYNGTVLSKIVNSSGGVIWEAFDVSRLVDFEYTDNGNGTYTITGWKGTYNGTASTICVIPDDYRVIL